MTRDEMSKWMDRTFAECKTMRDAGQKEYARRDENCFANFERVSERVGITREQALMTYCEKHLDGIHAYIGGHKSQREDVRGRIVDSITYLCLLRAMIEETETPFIANASDYRLDPKEPLCTFPGCDCASEHFCHKTLANGEDLDD